jgi:hypothetical protein
MAAVTSHAHDEAGWQYQIVWRYRAISLVLAGLLALGFGVLGGTHIATSVQNAQAYQRARTLASLSSAVTGLAAHLQDERDQTMMYIGLGTEGRAGALTHVRETAWAQNLTLVTQEQKLTAPWVQKVRTESARIGAGYSAQVQQSARDVVGLLGLFGPDRKAATQTRLPAVVVMQSYTRIIDGLLSLDHNIALGSGDAALSNDVVSLNLVSLIGEEASEQRGFLAYAFAQNGQFDPAVLAGVQTAQEQQKANIAEFDQVATPPQVALYQNKVQGSLVDFASNYEQQAIQVGLAGQKLNVLPTSANEWYGSMTTGTLGDIRAVEQDLVTATIARASALHRNAIIAASVIGAAIVIVLVLALLLTTLVGRRVLGQRRTPSLRTTALG